MKYTSYSGFEKHFIEAVKAHLAPVYLVSCAHAEDRKVILDKMAAMLSPAVEITRLSSGSLSKNVLPRTCEQSLFAEQRLFIVEEAVLEGEDSLLVQLSEGKLHKVFFFLGLAQGKEFKGVSDAVKKGAVWLDLSREKPWEREKRLFSSLREWVFNAGKIIDLELLEQLVHAVGSDWQKLERELEKLIAFVGLRRDITLSDFQQVVVGDIVQTTWQIAEEIVWGLKGIPSLPFLDTTEGLTLLGALRYQVQLGWQLASTSLDEPHSQIKPYQIQKYGKLAHAKPPLFFEKALLKLTELETVMKSSSLDPCLMLTRFTATLREMQ
ncbi:MAG: hypothetical protein KGZ39_02225 [Simkania sp.]|nr:hypothetical protein [Simkania sp.]